MNENKRLLYNLFSKIIKTVGYIVTAASVVFIARIVLSLNIDIVRIDHPVRAVIWIAGLIVLYCAFFSTLAYAWKLILQFVAGDEVPIPFVDIFPIYTRSNVYKYLPGNVMEFVGRNYLGVRLKLRHPQIALSSLLEIILSLAVAMLIAFIFQYETFVRRVNPFIRKEVVSRYAIWIGIGSVICFLVIWYLIAKKSFSVSASAFWSKRFLIMGAKTFFIYGVVFFSFGFSLVVIFTQVLGIPIALADFMTINSIFALSWVVGFITPGSPGGLGVKEAVLLILLAPMFGPDLTLLASVIHRVISIFGDLILLLVGSLVGQGTSADISTSEGGSIQG
jgi:hypothetical protein